MSGHPYSTNKLLPTFSSASSSCSSDYRNLSRGACTGLFFQLFDWNGRLHKKQRLRRKSLPAERPASPVLRDQTRECTTVPGAQHPNVIDGCSPPYNLHKQVADPSQREQTPPEKKKKKRSPNVVAKLMGLETMPSPDFRREKWPVHGQHPQSPLRIQKHEDRSLLSHPRIPSSRRSILKSEKANMDNSSSRWGSTRSPCLSQGPSSMRYHEDVLHNDVDCDGMLRKESARALTQSSSSTKDCKLGCILSPSNTHNKLVDLPTKSPLASKARVCLFEAVSRALEPNMQPKSADRNNENECGNASKELNLKTLSSSCVSSRLCMQKTAVSSSGSKPTNVCSYGSTSSLHAPRNKQRQLSFPAMDENTKEVAIMQRLNQGHGIHKDVGFSKCHQKHQGGEYGKEEKALKSCVRRQEQTCRQPSEGTGAKVQNATRASAKREIRGHKIRETSHEHQGELHGTSPSTSAMSSVLTDNSASTSSSATVKSWGVTSSCKAKTDKKSKRIASQDVAGTESRSRRESVLTRRAGSQGRIAKSRSALTNTSNLGSKKSHLGKNMMMESGFMNSFDRICEDDDPLAEALSRNTQNSNGVVHASILNEKDCSFSTSAETTIGHLNTLDIASDHNRVAAAESGCGGSCVTSLDRMSDTASSSSHKRKQTVSYSGKSTATILQELLSALNPSARPMVEHDDDDSELSEITSRTTQIRECASMGEEHTKEECLDSSINSYAHHYSEEVCSGSISNREDWLLGVCKDDQQHISLELTINHNTQEGQNQSSGCGPNRRKGGEGNRKEVMSEEDFVKCIVDNTDLSSQDVWRPCADKSMVEAALFEELEKTTTHNWVEICHGLHKEWYQNLARGYRKLVFDCVQEALNLDVGITQQLSHWNCTPQLEYLQSQTRCQRVIKHLNNWKGARCGMNVDDLVEKAMNTGSGKWDDFSNEFPTIVEQVGQTIVDDIIDELVLDLSSSRRDALDARSVKAMLDRSQRKALIWVGL